MTGGRYNNKYLPPLKHTTYNNFNSSIEILSYNKLTRFVSFFLGVDHLSCKSALLMLRSDCLFYFLTINY